MAIRLGIDVGGTFTDLVLIDEDTGRVQTAKSSTTPGDPIAGVLAAIRQTGVADTDIGMLIHGTTVATNALLEHKGARTGFVCTKGFRDIIFIQRMNRKHHYDLTWDKPELPVNRRDCLEVTERVDYMGRVLAPLDETEARAVAREMAARGIEAVAICFLFSFVYPAHELRMREIFAEEHPTAELSLSHEVFPRWREYERASTTILDAFLKPLVGRYVRNVHDGLQANGIHTNFLMMKSNGGMTDAGSVAKKPIDLMVSGPVGGVLAAVYLGQLTERKNIISTDMGGTSFDVSLIADGKFGRSNGIELEWGIPIRAPMVNVETVGAGGGSLAWIDNGGLLRVGPQSASARPGPVCYGRGGTEPTVTDANVVLGRLNPQRFANGQMALDKDGAEAAVARYADRLQRGLEQTAYDIVNLVNWNMVNAIRLVSIDQGRDPRDFTLMSFGGAGSAHAAALAEMLDMHEVMVPVHQGVLSAFGLTTADMRVDVSQTANMRSDLINLNLVNTTRTSLSTRAIATLENDGYEGEATLVEAIEMRYLGQNYGVEVLVPQAGSDLDASSLLGVYDAFRAQHEKLYGYSIAGEVIEFVNFHTTAIGPVAKAAIAPLATSRHAAVPTTRNVYFEEAKSFVDCPVYWRDDLSRGFAIDGPAVVEEAFSLTLLHPGQKLAVDKWGNLIIRTRKGIAADAVRATSSSAQPEELASVD